MANREHVLAVLRKRFREASARQFAEAANAIVALSDEWEEVQAQPGAEIRIFRKRPMTPEVAPPESSTDRLL